MGHVSRIRKTGKPVHCTVVCNKLSLNASIGKLVDGFDAVIWLVKKNGGSMHYGELLRQLRNPRRV